MLPTFVIGLREGLEAALIIGIIAAFLKREGKTSSLRLMWIGVGLAVAICVAVGVGLQLLAASLPQAQQEGLETIIGAAAVATVTYMIVWMRRHARDLKGHLEGAAGAAIAAGTAYALVVMAFLAVLREGFETAVFLLAAFQASGSPLASGIGALAGIVIACGIGYGIYRGAARIDLARFFRLTGIVLVLVAAGLVASALHTAHEAGWIDIGQAQALDLAGIIAPGSAMAALVTGVLGVQARPTQIEVLGWLVYAVPMLLFVTWPQQRRRPPAAIAATSLVVAVMVVFAACAGSGPSGGSASPSIAGPGDGAPTTISVSLTDAGCMPQPATAPAGAITFRITNVSAATVTEFEILQGERILGEKENLAIGLSGSFSLELTAGTYTAYCPGATTEKTDLVVTASGNASAAPADDPALTAATDGYATYVKGQVKDLVAATRAFAAAVTSGDVALAKRLYAPARVPYERIEPVAESFGDLDPAIDIREGDVTDPATWTGFHRIEKALWVEGTTDGMAPIAQRLVDDVLRLESLVATETYQPARLANGASELLDEVARSKITGEEEAYSHLDLVDFQANVDGARAAFELLRPILETTDAPLAASIADRFDQVDAALADHRQGTSFVLYTSLASEQIRDLAGKVDALAEPLAEVAARIVGG